MEDDSEASVTEDSDDSKLMEQHSSSEAEISVISLVTCFEDFLVVEHIETDLVKVMIWNLLCRSHLSNHTSDLRRR